MVPLEVSSFRVLAVLAASSVLWLSSPSATSAQQPVVVAAEPAEPPAPAPREDDDPVRFRFGIELGPDVLLGPSLLGLGVGMTARLGVQVNQWVGVYYQPHGMVGGWLTDGAVGVIAGFDNTAMVELTLPFVHFGVGPSLDVLAVAGCDGEVGCLSSDSVFFGLDGRLALVIGGVGRGARGGFAINVHAHPTFVGDTVVLRLTLGIGGELF